MNQIVSSQAQLFLTSIEIGIVMGMIFDLLRISRKIIKHPNFFIQIEDLLYWITCSLIGFYMLYICNYAEIRPFVFIGIVLGAILYFASFSIIFMKLATQVINYIKKVLHRLWCLFLIPVRWLIGMIKKPLRYGKNKYEVQKKKARVQYRIKKRINYQKQADRRTEQVVKSELKKEFKKINLEEKKKNSKKDRGKDLQNTGS